MAAGHPSLEPGDLVRVADADRVKGRVGPGPLFEVVGCSASSGEILYRVKNTVTGEEVWKARHELMAATQRGPR